MRDPCFGTCLTSNLKLLKYIYLSTCVYISYILGGMVGLCVKRSPLTKVTPVRFPDGAICELSCALVLCCATRVFQNIRFSSLGKNQTLSIMAVLCGHNGLMWLAAKGAPCMPASRTRCSRVLRNSALSCE